MEAISLSGAQSIPEWGAHEVAVLLQEGEYWTLTYGGVTTYLRDAKGLRYLAHLLRHPGDEVRAIDLARMVSSAGAAPPMRACADGIPDPFGDRVARSAYSRRLADLAEEQEEAERLNEVGRAARAAAERAALADYVHRTSGLGGRTRRIHSDLERGRSAVSKRLKDVLERIRIEQPVLGRFLAATIHTGYACSYRPNPDAGLVWRVHP